MKQTTKLYAVITWSVLKALKANAVFYNVSYLTGGISVFRLKFGCSDRKRWCHIFPWINQNVATFKSDFGCLVDVIQIWSNQIKTSLFSRVHQVDVLTWFIFTFDNLYFLIWLFPFFPLWLFIFKHPSLVWYVLILLSNILCLYF